MLTTERRKDLRRRQKNIVFIPLFASSESQMGLARNVLSDVTLIKSIVSWDIPLHYHIKSLQ